MKNNIHTLFAFAVIHISFLWQMAVSGSCQVAFLCWPPALGKDRCTSSHTTEPHCTQPQIPALRWNQCESQSTHMYVHTGCFAPVGKHQPINVRHEIKLCSYTTVAAQQFSTLLQLSQINAKHTVWHIWFSVFPTRTFTLIGYLGIGHCLGIYACALY